MKTLFNAFMRPGCWPIRLIALIALGAAVFAGPGSVRAAPAGQEPAPALQGTSWRWIEFVNPLDEVIAVPSPEAYTIEFLRGNRVAGKSDCNTYTGTYRQTEYDLVVGRLSATKVCSEESVSQAFQTGLLATRAFTREGGTMVMILTSNAGKMRFTLIPDEPPAPAPTPVITPTAPASAAPAALAQKVWKWRQYVGYSDSRITVPDPANYTIRFEAGALVVDADCGRVTSAFTASDEALRVDGLSAAELRCGAPSLANEFARDLSYAASYRVQGEQLVINLAMDLGALVFTSGDPASQPAETKMPVQVWQWDGHLSSAGKSITPKKPAQYTFAFDADGGFSFRAECNVGKGAYVANGNQLDMSVGAASTGQCGKGSLSKTFMGLLDDVTGYTVMGDHLYLDVKYDAGVMSFSKVGAKPPANPLMGRVWRWRSRVSEDGVRINNARPSAYTLNFLPGGRVALVSDCVRSMGQYVLDGSRLGLKFPRLSGVFCGDGSYADDFVRWLEDAVGMNLQNNTLTVNLKFDSGSLYFGR